MSPDFSRDVRLVLGLPFDVLTMTQAEVVLRSAIARRTRCFLTTPNLNFAVSCLHDAAFRASVLQSDLSLADGWPVVAIGRLTGAALPERVAGSTLFERLAASASRPAVRVYFFGGPDGAAEAASARLNADPASGTVCTGFDAPGFGSIAEMSTPTHLDRLNRAQPDFVVVALGAKKGQAWIQNNLGAIDAPVISHLGAVVNFVAGAISRAPGWVQAARLEWLWRIREEPHLWRRYAGDGWALARLLATRVIPLAIQVRFTQPSGADLAAATVRRVDSAEGATLQLAGAWTRSNLAPLRDAVTALAESRKDLSLDLAAVSHLDSAAIALIALLQGWQLKIGASWQVVNASAAIRRTLHLACADYLLTPEGTR